jgi:hypothetical protein
MDDHWAQLIHNDLERIANSLENAERSSERDALLAVARAAKVMIDRLPNNKTGDGVYTIVEIEHALAKLPDQLKAEIEQHGPSTDKP